MDNISERRNYFIKNNNMLYVHGKPEEWTQGDEKLIYMNNMEENHLSRAIKKVKGDIERLTKTRSIIGSSEKEIAKEVIVLAKCKLKELEDEYKRRI